MGAAEVQAEVDGNDVRTGKPAEWHKALMHAGGPASLQHNAYSMQDKLTHAAKEVTLWLPGRTLSSDELKKLASDPRRADTTLGHAINAASLSRVGVEILKRIAKKLDVDISDID